MQYDDADNAQAENPTYTGPSTPSQIPNWVQPGTPNLNSGGFFGALSSFMDAAIPVFIAAGTAYLGASIAGGIFGAGEAGAAAAGAGDAAGAGLGDLSAAGLGQLPIDTAALGPGSASFAGLGGGMDAVGAATTAAGAGVGSSTAGSLGSMIGVEGGAPAVVSVGAPAATAGGMGVPATALGAGLGAGAILGSNPTLPIDAAALQTPPPINGVSYPDPGTFLPPVVAPPLNQMPPVNPVADGAANIPVTPPVYTAPGGTGGTPTGGVTPPGTGGLGGLLGGLGPILGGLNDYQNSQADQDFWKNQLDTLQGMYKPGTLEATQMEDKMNALDAANGRNSQYGVRAVNLASNLATQRAGIMTSAGYQNMANAYRNRSSQDLNGLFSAMGNPATQNLLSSAGNTISNLFTG